MLTTIGIVNANSIKRAPRLSRSLPPPPCQFIFTTSKKHLTIPSLTEINSSVHIMLSQENF